MFKIIGFGSTITLVLYGMIFVTFKIYSTYLRLNPFWNRTFFIIMALMPILFIGSVLLTRSSHYLNSLIYTIIQIISGIGFYIFLGAIILGLVGIMYFIFGKTVSVSVAFGFLILPLLLAGLGFWQARHIKITQYSVQIKNLPKEWQDKKVALVTDTHFGLVNYKNFSNHIVNKLLQINPSFILHAGDFYDGPNISTVPITESWKRLTSKIPVFYTPGNHEKYGDYVGFIQSIQNAGVTVLEDKMTKYQGLQIAGIIYRDKNKEPEVAQAIINLHTDPKQPLILINHPPTFATEASDAGVDLMVSGHTHNGQFWPNTYLVKMTYGIYSYGIHYFKNTTVITSDGIGTFGPPMRLFNPPEIVLITLENKD